MSKKPSKQTAVRRQVGTLESVQQSTVDSAPRVLGEDFGVASVVATENPQMKSPSAPTIFDRSIPDWYARPQDARDYLAIYALEELENARIPMFFHWITRRVRMTSTLEPKTELRDYDDTFGIINKIASLIVFKNKQLYRVIAAKLRWVAAQLKVDIAAETADKTGVDLFPMESEARTLAHDSNRVASEANLTASHLGNDSSVGTPTSSGTRNLPPGIREAAVGN